MNGKLPIRYWFLDYKSIFERGCNKNQMRHHGSVWVTVCLPTKGKCHLKSRPPPYLAQRPSTEDHVSHFFSGPANQLILSQHGEVLLNRFSAEWLHFGCISRPSLFMAHWTTGQGSSHWISQAERCRSQVKLISLHRPMVICSLGHHSLDPTMSSGASYRAQSLALHSIPPQNSYDLKDSIIWLESSKMFLFNLV